MRGSIYDPEYKPHFSGHETFPLRYGWLKKAFDAVTENSSKTVFLDEDAIARFGVGKNMVTAIRYWATAMGVIKDSQNAQSIITTEFGKKLFGKDGLDPYMEHPATLWIIHWLLASNPKRTTWFWGFNHFPKATFERSQLVKDLFRLSKDCRWKNASEKTLKNDTGCFIRTYALQQTDDHTSHDDTLESPLTELGLIKAIDKDYFRFVRGSKPSLGNGVFTCALLEFWSKYSPDATTISFEAIAHEPASPGRVFLLDEDDIVVRLMAISDMTKGMLRWSETTGLKQVVSIGREKENPLSYIDGDYSSYIKREVA